MGQDPRILHTADSHVGADWPANPRTDRPRRGDDLVRSFERVIVDGMDQGVDLIIHAGDLFDRARPSSRSLAAAAAPLLRAAAQGIPVVLVPGNHERSMIPANLFLSHPNIFVLASPKTLTFRLCGRSVAVAGFPCLRRDAGGRFPKALEETGWSEVHAEIRILAVHETFESAVCGPADYRFRSGTNVVERSCIPKEFDYVAAGHVHRQQQLLSIHAEGPGVVYCGSPDRISFAEAGEPKGWVLVQEEGGRMSATFVSHEVRPMIVYSMDISGLSTRQIQDGLEETLAGLLPDAVAQIRVTGRTTRTALAGIRFAGTARRLRPDVLLSASVAAVEYAPGRAVANPCRVTKSALAGLNLAQADLVRLPVTQLESLPAHCGVYVLYDAGHRPLYVGKSKRVRARIRSHLRGKKGVNFFQGWPAQVAWIEVLETDSELEALLAEAEVIRHVGPSFNRQMRRWRDYCYLVQDGAAYGQLAVSKNPGPPHRCFGPFRSRGQAAAVCLAAADQFEVALCPDEEPPLRPLPLFRAMSSALVCERHRRGLCPGPCMAVDGDPNHDRAIRRRNEFLAGQEDAPLRELELRLQSMEELLEERAQNSPLERRAGTLRAAFDHASMLRRAHTLMNGLLIMPGPVGRRRTVVPTMRGMQFGWLANTMDEANRVLRAHADLMRHGGRWCDGVLPRPVVDGLCIAVRHLSGQEGLYEFVPAIKVKQLDAGSLLALAFASDQVTPDHGVH